MLKVSQGPYINVILAQFHMQDANPVLTPFSGTVKFTVPHEKTSSPKIDVPYAKAIGSLMYAALGTRPNLAFAVQHLSQFTISHGQEHWTAVKNALCYLKGTCDAGIVFKKDTMWIYFEGSTSSMRATVLLQTVCNALLRGQRLFLTMSQICQLEGGFW